MTSPPTSSTAAASPTTLLLFVPAQNPLPVRYPHPHKPRLHLPPLVHRALHLALDGDQPSFLLVPPAPDANEQDGEDGTGDSDNTGVTNGSGPAGRDGNGVGRGRTVIIPHPDVIVKQDEPARDEKAGASAKAGVTGEANGDGTIASKSAGAAETSSDSASTTFAQEAHLSTGPEGLVGAQVESEITFKLHLVGDPSSSLSSSSSSSGVQERASRRLECLHEALSIASTYKGLSRVDTLLIGWKGVDYKGRKTAVSEFFGCGAEGMEGGSGVENVSKEVEDDVAATWGAVSADLGAGAVGGGGDGKGDEGGEGGDGGEGVKGGEGGRGKVKVGSLGTLYLPLGVLKRLTEGAEGAERAEEGQASSTQTGDHDDGARSKTGTGKGQGPTINMLDTPDCHSLPKEYTAYAKEQGIALWAGGGGEGADPLPDADLHNVLNEFQPLLASSIFAGTAKTSDTHNTDDTHNANTSPSTSTSTSSPISNLQKLIPLRADELKYETIPRPAVAVKWALGYTVISKSRNVVKDKG